MLGEKCPTRFILRSLSKKITKSSPRKSQVQSIVTDGLGLLVESAPMENNEASVGQIQRTLF